MPSLDTKQAKNRRTARALELRKLHPDWGYIRIGNEMGWDKDKVRRAIEHAERKKPNGSTALTVPSQAPVIPYEAACRAIAAARTFDDVKEWSDRAAAIREYGRRAKDRTMEIDALAIQAHAERRRGELLIELKQMGLLIDGRPKGEKAEAGPPKANPKTVVDKRPLPPPTRITLESLGISKDESARAQRIAALKPETYDKLIDLARQTLQTDTRRHSLDVLKQRDGIVTGARAIAARRQEPDDSLDPFPTPPWATRALFEHALPRVCHPDRTDMSGNPYRPTMLAWEPACGDGIMSETLKEYFATVYATDIFDYQTERQNEVYDFLDPSHPRPMFGRPVDWIITNPPFNDKSTQFVIRALEKSACGVAMFVRSQWAVEGIDRYEKIFRDRPPTLCAFFVERVNLCRGRWDPDGSTLTAYCWLIWVKDQLPQPPFWIPPGCRVALTKPDDRARFAAWSVSPDNTPAGKMKKN